MRDSKVKRESVNAIKANKQRKYYGMERTKVTTYSATHKPDYTIKTPQKNKRGFGGGE